jgi:hypothetical protein
MKCSRYFRLLLIAATLCLTGPFDVRAAVVLQYHHVSVTTPASTSTSPERFAMHLAYLAGQGFEVVPLAALVQRLRSGQPLADIVFTDGDVRPVLALRFEEEFDTGRINCFASGQGRAQLLRQNSTVRVQAERGLGPGRSRYNCTAPSGQAGRFFWYSQLWIVRP